MKKILGLLMLLVSLHLYAEVSDVNVQKEEVTDVRLRKGDVIVDFYGTWCMPCKMLAPIVEKVAKDKNIKLAKVDVDENEKLVREFKIMSVPTLKIFKNGVETATLVGLTSENKIIESIE